MALTVTMPQLGESVTEGTIARWLKQPGEFVAKYESIAEVITDKVNAEIPSPADGSMGEHIAKEGDVVAVGQPICTIETVEAAQQRSAWAQPTLEAEAVPEAAPSAEAVPVPAVVDKTVGQPSPPSVPVDTSGYHLTPAVRALIEEHGIEISRLRGSGIGGRITRKDVLDYVSSGDSAPPAVAVPAVAGGPSAPESQPVTVGEGDVLVPLSSMRRAIAEHMVRSKHTSPHAWLMVDVDMTRVFRLRAARKDEFKRRHGVALTFPPFVARATCEALHEFPAVNSMWGEAGIVEKRDIHLGIAVALEDNLIVPVVRHADRLSVAGLATTMTDLAERARTNKLKLDEIQGGTFTLNNTGALGTVLSQPIINQPQAGILAMEAVVKRPVVVEGDAIAVRPMMNLCFSFDHRIIDGLQASRFALAVKKRLEGFDDASTL